MIGNLYTITVQAEGQAAAKTLMEFAAPSTAVELIERVYVTQSGFQTSEMLAVKGQKVTTTGTGTSQTPAPWGENTAAAGGTHKTNMSAESSYTANKLKFQEGFNVLSGFKWTPASDEEVVILAPSALFGVRLEVNPSISMNFSYGATFRQIG